MSYWDLTTGKWSVDVKVEYTYDANGNNTLYNSFLWNKTNGQWSAFNRLTNYYSVPITIFNPEILNVYPNPAIDYVVFEVNKISKSATVEIFDMQGKKVIEKKLNENGQISISNLTRGMYVYWLNNIGTIYTGKLIVY